VVTPKPVQEEKQYEAEVKVTKATKAKPTIASSNKRFGGHKSSIVKTPVQDNNAQNIEEPSSAKTFKRSNRFTVKSN
jgi:hypothetical protein